MGDPGVYTQIVSALREQAGGGRFKPGGPVLAKCPARPGDRGVTDDRQTPVSRVRVRTPQALGEIAPHLLGFVLRASMVVLGTEAGRARSR